MIAAPGVDIKARAVVIDGGPATVVIRSHTPAGIQLTTAGISGTLNVTFQQETARRSSARQRAGCDARPRVPAGDHRRRR